MIILTGYEEGIWIFAPNNWKDLRDFFRALSSELQSTLRPGERVLKAEDYDKYIQSQPEPRKAHIQSVIKGIDQHFASSIRQAKNVDEKNVDDPTVTQPSVDGGINDITKLMWEEVPAAQIPMELAYIVLTVSTM
ncbi:hypothetical protein CEP54_014631 [Fusarium duplospermum]|uniref:Uncharacterized protein n=1 Tax=Fusarium duplospermum TaxID=1325734 RepID=A0A428NUY3_9HYPO|nr:hypothetical protein CEP54_014631 [Fusarium duplospermum]